MSDKTNSARARLIDPRYIVVAVGVAAALMLSLCGLGAIVSYRLRLARARPSATPNAFVCAQPSMTILTGATPAPVR